MAHDKKWALRIELMPLGKRVLTSLIETVCSTVSLMLFSSDWKASMNSDFDSLWMSSLMKFGNFSDDDVLFWFMMLRKALFCRIRFPKTSTTQTASGKKLNKSTVAMLSKLPTLQLFKFALPLTYAIAWEFSPDFSMASLSETRVKYNCTVGVLLSFTVRLSQRLQVLGDWWAKNYPYPALLNSTWIF